MCIFFESGGFERSPDDARCHVQHVNGAEDDSKRGERSEIATEVRAGERAEDREEFADETVRSGEPDAREGEEDEEERELGHHARQSRKRIDVARVVAV